MMWKLFKIHISVFIRFYWMIPMLKFFVCGCFCATTAEQNNCDKGCITCRAKYLLCGSL